MFISIIIPTFNRATQLLLTLHSLVRLKTSRNLFEIIIIDNGSSDTTKEIVEKCQFENEDVEIRYFYDDTPGLLSGRHRGAFESKGDILTFIDDDVNLSGTWLDSIITVMENRDDVDFLTGPNLPLYEKYPPKWLDYFWENAYEGKYCTWLSLLDLGGEIQEIHPNFVWGLNFTIRKSVFLELGGFHPDNIPEQYQKFQGDGETGITMKAYEKGLKALYHPGVLLFHQVLPSRLTLEYFERRAYYQGVSNSFADLRLKHKENEKIKINNSLVYKINVLNKIKRLIKKILSTTKKENKQNIPTDVQDILMRVSIKEKEGYFFHQKMYNENELVRNWVNQENFMKYKLPSQ
jgi:glycosyltransferase involved in cell wall biosynthesis